MSSHNGTAFFSSSMSSLGAVSTASASRGMALRMFPPCHSAKRAPKFAIASRTKRASSLLAFARPSFISNPECPPFNPESSTFIATSSERRHFFVFQFGGNVYPAGASDYHLPFGLVVEVKENAPLQGIGLQVVNAVHAGFLVHCKQSFERAVLQGIVFHYSHNRSHAYSVVGAESSAFGLYPVAVDISFYRVVLEIVIALLYFLRHHVHVCLHGYHLQFFVAGCGGLAHYYIAGVVGMCFDRMFFCPVEQKVPYLVKVSRGTGHLCQGVKVTPKVFGFQILNFAHDIFVF